MDDLRMQLSHIAKRLNAKSGKFILGSSIPFWVQKWSKIKFFETFEKSDPKAFKNRFERRNTTFGSNFMLRSKSIIFRFSAKKRHFCQKMRKFIQLHSIINPDLKVV